MSKMQLRIGDQTLEVERVEFRTESEPWSSYAIVADGTVVKLKIVVTDIYRTDQKDPVTGEMQYIVKSSNVMAVETGSWKQGGGH